MSPQVRVFLADSHTLLLDAFERMLSHQFDVVGTAKDVDELNRRWPTAAPDVIVLDIAMSQSTWIGAARTIHHRHDVGFVFVTTNNDPRLAAEALEAIEGASYLTTSSTGAEFIEAIVCASQGQTYITPHMAQSILGAIRANSRMSQPTPRQREVLKLLAKGKSMKEVGAALGISARTVAHHKYTMMKALDIESSAELIHYANRLGILHDR